MITISPATKATMSFLFSCSLSGYECIQPEYEFEGVLIGSSAQFVHIASH